MNLKKRWWAAARYRNEQRNKTTILPKKVLWSVADLHRATALRTDLAAIAGGLTMKNKKRQFLHPIPNVGITTSRLTASFQIMNTRVTKIARNHLQKEEFFIWLFIYRVTCGNQSMEHLPCTALFVGCINAYPRPLPHLNATSILAKGHRVPLPLSLLSAYLQRSRSYNKKVCQRTICDCGRVCADVNTYRLVARPCVYTCAKLLM